MEHEFEWDGQKYHFEWIDSTDFESFENVTQCYGFIFDDEGRLCIINCTGKWCLPGGKPEKGETYEEALIREVDEEADLDIKDIRPVGAFKITPMSKNCQRDYVHYILRYAARVKKVKKQTIDPAENIIPGRNFINPKDFLEHVHWKGNGEFQLKKAMEVMGLNINN